MCAVGSTLDIERTTDLELQHALTIVLLLQTGSDGAHRKEHDTGGAPRGRDPVCCGGSHLPVGQDRQATPLVSCLVQNRESWAPARP